MPREAGGEEKSRESRDIGDDWNAVRRRIDDARPALLDHHVGESGKGVRDIAFRFHEQALRRLGIEASLAGMELSLEAWVDEAGGVVRRVVQHQRAPATADREAFEATMTIDYTDLGIDVDVSAPPADAVVDSWDLEQNGDEPEGC